MASLEQLLRLGLGTSQEQSTPAQTVVDRLGREAPAPPATSPTSSLLAVLQMVRQRGQGRGSGAPGIIGSGGSPNVARIASKFVGNPYVYANEGQVVNGQRTFDCSGLVDFALNRAGFKVPRLSAAGYQSYLPPIHRNQIRPGDPVYFDYEGAGHATHVGIALGGGRMVAAASPSQGVKTEPIDWSHYIGASRVPH